MQCLANVKRLSVCLSVVCQSINQYRKRLHRDVASTVQIITVHTKNSSGYEIANVNFLYDDIVHV